jgi:hypothetical protein
MLALGAMTAVACGKANPPPPAVAPPADRFDADAARRTIEMQLRYGQRPAGSPQLRRLALRLRALLPHGRFEAVPGDPRLRNVVGTVPGRKPAVVQRPTTALEETVRTPTTLDHSRGRGTRRDSDPKRRRVPCSIRFGRRKRLISDHGCA